MGQGDGEQYQLQAGAIGKVPGWISMPGNANANKTLKIVEASIVPKEECIAPVDTAYFVYVPKDKICARADVLSSK